MMKKLSAKENKERMFKLVKECLTYKGQKEEFIKLNGLVRQRYYYWQKRYMEEQNFTSSNFKKMDDVSFTKLEPFAWEENSIKELKGKKQVELNFSSGLRITIFE
jgi:hypothetical protein